MGTRQPVLGDGRARFGKRLAGAAGHAAAVLLFIGSLLGLMRNVAAETETLARREPFATIQRWMEPSPPAGRRDHGTDRGHPLG